MSSSDDESKAATASRHGYEEIEEAVMESARGRWFLREYANRHRAADTLTLLAAIERLQNAVSGVAAEAAPSAGEIVALAEAIRSTRGEIAKMRSDRDGSAIEDASNVYATIAEQAKRTTAEIMAATQHLYSLAGELKAANANDRRVANIELGAQSLETLALSQDLLSRRIASAMGLLAHVDGRIAALAAMTKPQPVEEGHLKYFVEDEALFEPATHPPARPAPTERNGAAVTVPPEKSPGGHPAAEVQPEPAQDESRKRIMIIRRPASEAVEIPLADELPERVA